jgi:hypothetical protein
MPTADAIPRLYEELANHFARQGESRQRDNCLVLAADAALNIGMGEEAERLRKRLLLTNPHHLLRPYGSMAEAMASNDVRDYVVALRKRLPPETVARLLNRPLSNAGINSVASRPMPNAENAPAVDEPASPVSYLLALLVFGVGSTLAGAIVFFTFVVL